MFFLANSHSRIFSPLTLERVERKEGRKGRERDRKGNIDVREITAVGYLLHMSRQGLGIKPETQVKALDWESNL